MENRYFIYLHHNLYQVTNLIVFSYKDHRYFKKKESNKFFKEISTFKQREWNYNGEVYRECIE